MKDSIKKSKGLGDTIQKVTKALKIPTCKKCEERRKKLNKILPYVRKMSSDEYKEFIEFTQLEVEEYTEEQQEYIKETLLYTTGINLKACKDCKKNVWDFWIEKIKESFKNK